MKIAVLSEHGYEEAALGFSLSYNSTPERAMELFPKYAHKQGGHNKFLESMLVWIDVTAPRYWWAQADTYRIATKQSQSTMHTLGKDQLRQDHFERPIPERMLETLNTVLGMGGCSLAKQWLPESFLQRRIWCLSYKTLQNIVRQRENHKLPEWHTFCNAVRAQVKHPEFL